jgi:murein DD-endopeptidase MepM/ murein hydrolase activator NlpD
MSFRTILVLVGSLLVAAGSLVAYLVSQEPGPIVTIRQPVAIGGGSFAVDLSVDAHQPEFGRLEVWIEQGGRRQSVVTVSPASRATLTQETPTRVRLSQTLPTSTLGPLRDGTARLVVAASRPVLFGWRQARTEIGRDIKIRLAPPALSLVSSRHLVTLGGAEMVVYRVTPPDAVSGVTVGDRFYRGYPASGVSGSKAADPALHVAFFALAFDQDVDTRIQLTARDAAGNQSSLPLAHRAVSTKFARSRVRLNDRQLRRVLPPILSNSPDLALPTGTRAERIDAFLQINGDLRRRNDEQIASLTTSTSPEWLGRGPFRRLPGASAQSPFAQRRTYLNGRRRVDEQVHLGFDLASVRGAAVSASNAGRVVFAGYLGIYGNCIVLDHGMGVQTLYAHLSVMDVERGDRVEKGETIGHSGATGLAGGDHVHFTVLVGGTPVNPVEWWDARWVRDRIERRLHEAGIR